MQLRKQNEILIVGLDDAQNFLKGMVIALKYLSGMTLIIWQTKISFTSERSPPLNEINHVIVLRICVLADYANASLNGL